MPSNSGWLRLLGALAALVTVAAFLDDLGAGRLHWDLPQ